VSVWNKKVISKDELEKFRSKYGLDSLSASIMLRRGITQGKDILYFMEDDLRFQHSPFSFNSMEDAVDRILDAQEEKEKVLIFGDRDVDGVSATTVLYECLCGLGIDVQYRLPQGNDAYGLSTEAVDDFASLGGTLIITVDCGISNIAEIQHAQEVGIDVIVTDHHNPPETLPPSTIILDPKLPDSGYPFQDISGCAVVYKLVSALRFAKSEWYKQDVCLLDAREEDSLIRIECIKIRNMVPCAAKLSLLAGSGESITSTRLPSYLSGQAILVWDAGTVRSLLKQAFGSSAEFNLVDIREHCAKYFPSIANLPLGKIKTMSKIAKYGNHEPTEIGGFYNIFVTYTQTDFRKKFPGCAQAEERDMQLVALAALADIMPMKNENRLFENNAIAAINAGRVRPGLIDLMARLNMLGRRVNATDLSWVVVSHLNAAGRLGHPELAAELFLSKDEKQRDSVAQKIMELNNQRKQLSQDAWTYAGIQAKTSIPSHNGKLCVVIDERLNRGVNGILAGRLVATYNIPAIAVTFVEKNAIGSMRSCRGVDVTKFLAKMGDIFINYGGHSAAGGFSFEREKLPIFEERLKELSATLELSESKTDTFNVDAEIPPSFLTPDLLKISDRFEPFGEENGELLFLTRGLPVLDGIIMGKGEKQHLKITVGNGSFKWPALFWNEAERLHRDFEIGDTVDILFNVQRNWFNGVESPQLILHDIKKSIC